MTAISPGVGGPDIGRLWWLWLVTGTVWLIVALVVLQFYSASITTISACRVTSMSSATLLVDSASTTPLRTITAPNGSSPRAAPSRESSMQRRIIFWSVVSISGWRILKVTRRAAPSAATD